MFCFVPGPQNSIKQKEYVCCTAISNKNTHKYFTFRQNCAQFSTIKQCYAFKDDSNK